MKYLVDTCGWIEWLTDGKLAKQFEKYLHHPKELLIPTIVQHELHKWICRERDEGLALEIIGITHQGYVSDLNTSLALYSADLTKVYKLAMADAIIYATSQHYNVPLITCDSYFKRLPNIEYLHKQD